MNPPASWRVRQPLPSRRHFLARLLQRGGLATAFVLFSLSLGAVGYHWLAGLGWLDAYLNASMILTGEGPLAPTLSTGAKLFAIGYTLYSALAFLTVTAVLFGPVVVRLLHRMHIDLYGEAPPAKTDSSPS